MFCKGWPPEKQQKNNKISMKKQCKFRVEKNRSRSRLKSRFGRVLGSILGGFGVALGRLLATFGRILLAFWAFKTISFSSVAPKWAPRGLLDGFWVAFGRFWEVFGRVLNGLGRIWGPFEQLVGRFWACLNRFVPAGADSLIGPPRWSAKRHNARGSSTPRVLNSTLENVKSFISSK